MSGGLLFADSLDIKTKMDVFSGDSFQQKCGHYNSLKGLYLVMGFSTRLVLNSQVNC